MRDVVRCSPDRAYACPGTRAADVVHAGVVVFAALVSVLLAGCSQLEPEALRQPVTNPSDLYLRLALNYRAVNLATDATVPAANTVQLVATPYDGTNTPIAGAPAPTFHLVGDDTTKLKVTPDGLLQGRDQGNGIRVVADLSIGDVRHTDTAVVNVNAVAPVPVLDTFSIAVPPDSAVWYMINTNRSQITSVYSYIAGVAPLLLATVVTPHAVDVSGQPVDVSGLVVDYVSLDSTIAYVNSDGTIVAAKPGHARIVARTFAYGVAKADTMFYTVQPPFGSDEFVDEGRFRDPVTTIVAGGIVGWLSGSTQPMDVTFDDPAKATAPPDDFCNLLAAFFPPGPYCGAGNVAAFIGSPSLRSPDGSQAWRFRRFPVPGTYTYHSTTTGSTSRIVVLEPTPTPP